MDEQDGPAVRPEELRAAGAGCVAAALDVPVTAPAEAVRMVGRAVAALGGGRAGPAADALAQRWELAVVLLSADLVALGEALGAAAEAYDVGDADAAATLRGAVPGAEP